MELNSDIKEAEHGERVGVSGTEYLCHTLGVESLSSPV